MTSMSDWLKPTLLGPLLVTWVTTTLGTVLVGMHTLSGGRFDSWLLGMLIASFFASGLGGMLVTADVALLAWKLRKLPTGGGGWVSRCLRPFAGFLIGTVFPLPPRARAGG